MPDPDEDLDYWLATQALPKEQPPPQGAWARAGELLSRQQRPADPMPTRPNGMSWAAALAAIAGRDPGGVLAADAAARRADMDAWQRRNGPDAEFDRQRALAGTLMQEEAAQRAAEAQAFSQDRMMSADARQAGLDRAAAAQQKLENERAAAKDAEQIRQFGVSQQGLTERNNADNARMLEAAQLQASVRSEAQQALAQSRADTAAARKDAQLQREYNDFRNKNVKLFDLAQAARNIEETWDRNPVNDRPGAGTLDSRGWLHPFGIGQNDDDLAVRANFRALQEYLQNKVTGASAPKDQAARIAAIAGAQEGATEQEAAVSLNTVRNNLREQLRAAGTGREEAARKVLGDMGLAEWVYGKDPTPTQAAAEIPSPASPSPPAPPAAPGFEPKGVKVGKQAAVAPAEPGDLGPPTAVDTTDWKKRYERYKLGGGL